MAELTPPEPKEVKILSPELAARLVDASPVVSFVLAPDGKTNFVSPAVTKVFGLSPQEVMAGDANLENSIHPQDKEAAQTALNKWDKKEVLSRKYRIIGKEGKERWVTETRQISGEEIIGSIIDNTEAVTKGAQIATRTTAHYLNNTLTPVVGFAQLVQLNAKDRLSEEEKSDLGKIIEAGTKAADQIRRLRTTTESGSLQMIPDSSSILDIS